jgi:hypothetical protein
VVTLSSSAYPGENVHLLIEDVQTTYNLMAGGGSIHKTKSFYLAALKVFALHFMFSLEKSTSKKNASLENTMLQCFASNQQICII